ncbi:MAG: geranylgeranylglyceryl/heptaprenylglyceryl phosphate synthase [Bacteroidetes bacterium]|nr:geranylgeranylglyceryl/heptaprenylglyceryl phosphate synthase [Bacteroidota bacterium]
MILIEKLITESKSKGKKLFAWLIDPDKLNEESLVNQLKLAQKNTPDLIFLGGSLMIKNQINLFIDLIKEYVKSPIILFPGSTNQVTENADGILFLSLISGRNPDYLIGRHVEVAYLLKKSTIQVLPTGYILVDSGLPTTASYISNTFPLPYNKSDIAVSTAMAGELLGLRFIFLDGGSGAAKPISAEMITAVKQNVDIPLIVGGGICNAREMKNVFLAGADVAVVGNCIEKKPELMKDFYQAARSFDKNIS